MGRCLCVTATVNRFEFLDLQLKQHFDMLSYVFNFEKKVNVHCMEIKRNDSASAPIVGYGDKLARCAGAFN